MPTAESLSLATYTSASRRPLSIASRIFWAPDSTPIQTSVHPARCSAETVCGLIKSARDCILNGTTQS